MGSQVIAKCDCGVEAVIDIGSGMMDFTTRCSFPCLCESCHNVVEVNLLAKTIRCPKCRKSNPIPYDDPRLYELKGSEQVAVWNMQDKLGREVILTDGKYKCPKCGKMSLEFTDSGLCWD